MTGYEMKGDEVKCHRYYALQVQKRGQKTNLYIILHHFFSFPGQKMGNPPPPPPFQKEFPEYPYPFAPPPPKIFTPSWPPLPRTIGRRPCSRSFRYLRPKRRREWESQHCGHVRAIECPDEDIAFILFHLRAFV
jgi:hypothetical protein